MDEKMNRTVHLPHFLRKIQKDPDSGSAFLGHVWVARKCCRSCRRCPLHLDCNLAALLEPVY